MRAEILIPPQNACTKEDGTDAAAKAVENESFRLYFPDETTNKLQVMHCSGEIFIHGVNHITQTIASLFTHRLLPLSVCQGKIKNILILCRDFFNVQVPKKCAYPELHV